MSRAMHKNFRLFAVAVFHFVMSAQTPAQDSKPAAVLKGHTDAIWSLAFSPDGKTLASGGQKDGAILLWKVASGQ